MNDDRLINRYYVPNTIFKANTSNILSKNNPFSYDPHNKLNSLDNKNANSFVRNNSTNPNLKIINQDNGQNIVLPSIENYNTIKNDANFKSFAIDEILADINNLKRSVKSLIDNQAIFHSKQSELNKFISEIDSKLRLNTINLDDTDNKLTEMLNNFNSFLSTNEKYTLKLNKIYYKSENEFADKKSLEDVSNLLYELKKNIDFKNIENKNKIEELSNKLLESTQKISINLQSVIEKTNDTEKNINDNIIKLQEENILLEESRDKKLNEKLNLYNKKIDNLQSSIDIELSSLKLNYIDELKKENDSSFAMILDKISILEKSFLEADKKLLSFSKDYVVNFSELINQNNSKYILEIEKIKSLNNSISEQLENTIKCNYKNVNDYINEYKEKLNSMEYLINYEILEYKTILNKDLNDIKQKNLNNNNEIHNLKNELNKLNMYVEKEFSTNKLDNMVLNANNFEDKIIDSKIIKDKLIMNNIKIYNNEITEKFVKNFENKIKITIEDYKDKVDHSCKIIENNINLLDYKLNSIQNCYKEDAVSKEKLYSNKIEDINEQINEFKKKVIMMMNMHIDTFKKKLNNEQKDNLDIISSKLTSKTELIASDLKEESNNFRTLLEGRLRGLIIEESQLLEKKISNKVSKIQEKLENLNINGLNNENRNFDLDTNSINNNISKVKSNNNFSQVFDN